MQPHISLTPLPRSVTSMPRRRMPCGQCKSYSSIRINLNNSSYRYVWRPIPWGSVLLYNELHTVGRGNSIENGTTTIDSLYNGKYHLMIFAASSGFHQGWYGEIPTKTSGDWDNLLNEPKWIDIDGNTDLTVHLQKVQT